MVGVLLVEDSQMQRMIIDKALGKLGYTVTPVGSGEEALERYQQGAFDVLLLDVILPGIDGLEVLRQVRAKDQDQCVILMTAEGSGLSAVGAIRAGADDYVTKPIRMDDGGVELEVIISRSLERRSLARDNRRLQAELLDAQRVEAVMHLVGGAAHEMNQPLTVIMGMAELLSDAADPETLKEDLASMRRAALKLAEIVRKLASITDYRTRAYAENLEILDLDGSTEV